MYKMEPHQKVVATGFLERNGKVLVLKRSPNETFLPNFFEIAGGKCEYGEDPRDALKREYREETGLDIEVGDPYYTFSYVTHEGARHTVEIVFMIRMVNPGQPVTLSNAHTEYKWLSPNELDSIQISDEAKTSIRKGFEMNVE